MTWYIFPLKSQSSLFVSHCPRLCPNFRFPHTEQWGGLLPLLAVGVACWLFAPFDAAWSSSSESETLFSYSNIMHFFLQNKVGCI